jgi:hypothetical protein
MIEAQKQRLLSGPLTGDQAVDAERALRYNGFKNQGLQDPENQALGSAQLKLSDAVHQHMQDTLPLNADVSMDQLAQARQSLAQIHTLQGALKGNNVNLQGLAKVHRDNPGLLTGDMAQIADFADKHPEVTGLPSNEERFNPSGVVKDVASIDLKSPQSYLQPFFGALARRSLTGAKVAPTTSGLGNDLAPIDRTPQAPPGMTAGPMGVPPAAAGQPGQIPLAELLAHGLEYGPPPGLSAGPMGAPAPQGMPFTPNLNHAAGGLEVAPPQHTYGGQPANNSDLGSVMSQPLPDKTIGAPRVLPNDSGVNHSVNPDGSHVFSSPNGSTTAVPLPGGGLKVIDTKTESGAQNAGEGGARLQAAADFAHSTGDPLVSDTRVSGPEQHVYASLKRKGYDVRTNPSTLDKGTGERLSASELKGVYEIHPPLGNSMP